MVKITDITSDGGDPNKKPQEEENQNEQPQQHKVENLYALIGFPPFEIPRWYILHRRNNSLRLSMIDSLPPLIPGSAVVTIGHEIYIIGGCLAPYPPVRAVSVIDCRFHTQRRLPNMRRARHHAASGVVDGKIYVIGGCIKQGGDWIEVFDVNNQSWATVPGQNPWDASFDGVFGLSVVMDNKIYILDRMCCLVYEPGRRRWKSWQSNEILLWWFWHGSCCVIDDMLYIIDPMCTLGYPIVVFDPKSRYWRTVKGLQNHDLFNFVYYHYKLANLGGKLVILATYQSLYITEIDIWCIVIALETRQDGLIRGNVESVTCVFSSSKKTFIEHSPTVTV